MNRYEVTAHFVHPATGKASKPFKVQVSAADVAAAFAAVRAQGFRPYAPARVLKSA